MFSQTVQPSPLVLFSSLSISSPFDNASLSIDPQLASDSFIALVNDQSNQIIDLSHPTHQLQHPAPDTSPGLVRSPSGQPLIFHHPSYSGQTSSRPLLGTNDSLQSIRSTVLHIQSPSCLNTFIRFPGLGNMPDTLSITLPFLHLHLKLLNHTFMFEVGVIDHADHQTILRFSNFQSKPKRYSLVQHHQTKKSPASPSSSPPCSSSEASPSPSPSSSLIHLPIKFPIQQHHSQTNWSEILINLKSFVSNFKSIQFIKIHSNVRLRRIYFSIDGLSNFSIKDSIDDDEEDHLDQFKSTQHRYRHHLRPELLLFGAQAQRRDNQEAEEEGEGNTNNHNESD